MSIFVLMAMLLSVLLAACGGGGPKGVVQDYIKAIEKLDADKLNDTLCSSADPTEAGAVEMLGLFAKIEFDDMKFEETQSSDNAATIHVTGTMKVEAIIGSEEMPLDSIFELVKEDGDWCIVSSTDN